MLIRRAAFLFVIMFLLAACGGEDFEPVPRSRAPAETETDDAGDAVPDVPLETLEVEIVEEPEPEEPEPIPDDSPPTYNGFEYRNLRDGIRITRYIGEELDVMIPSEIDGVTVTDIGSRAFENTGVKSVYIPDSVIKIGWNVFEGCEDIIITLRGKTFTYEDRFNLDDTSIRDIQIAPDIVTAWEEVGEWDVSELVILIDDGVMAYNRRPEFYNAIFINLDGTVRAVGLSFSLPSAEGYVSTEIWYNSNKDLVFNSAKDDSLPIIAQFDKIPDDIVESVRTLGLSMANVAQMHSTGYTGTGIFLIVGAGEKTHFIEIGRRGGTWYIGFDEEVNELYRRIDEWQTEQCVKHFGSIWYMEELISRFG
jgi:hypothetical protein